MNFETATRCRYLWPMCDEHLEHFLCSRFYVLILKKKIFLRVIFEEFEKQRNLKIVDFEIAKDIIIIRLCEWMKRVCNEKKMDLFIKLKIIFSPRSNFIFHLWHLHHPLPSTEFTTTKLIFIFSFFSQFKYRN